MQTQNRIGCSEDVAKCEEALVSKGDWYYLVFPPPFFVCHVVRCSELAVLWFSVVLFRQHNVIFDGTLSETLLACSGETTCPMCRH